MSWRGGARDFYFPLRASRRKPRPPDRPSIDRASAADPESIFKHLLAHAIVVLGDRHQAIADDMKGGLIGDQQGPGQKVCLRLDTAVAGTIAVLGQRWSAFVTEKAVGELVADVAPLAERMMGVVVHDGR